MCVILYIYIQRYEVRIFYCIGYWPYADGHLHISVYMRTGGFWALHLFLFGTVWLLNVDIYLHLLTPILLLLLWCCCSVRRFVNKMRRCFAATSVCVFFQLFVSPFSVPLSSHSMYVCGVVYLLFAFTFYIVLFEKLWQNG